MEGGAQGRSSLETGVQGRSGSECHLWVQGLGLERPALTRELARGQQTPDGMPPLGPGLLAGAKAAGRAGHPVTQRNHCGGMRASAPLVKESELRLAGGGREYIEATKASNLI